MNIVTENPQEIPYGYCQCGCGQKAPIAKVTRRNRNQFAGQPRLFIPHHEGRQQVQDTNPNRICKRCGKAFTVTPSTLAEGRGKGTYCSYKCRRPDPPKVQQPVDLPPATGLCLCGCGQPTPIAKQTNKRYGYIKGQPIRYIHNHNRDQARPEKRFWDQVDTSGGDDACWPWLGTRSDAGYGQIGIDGRHELAHRYSYMLHIGPLGPDEHVCHVCDNPPCANPRHLFKGSAADNMTDKVKKGRHLIGSQVGTSKLTEDQVREIRARYAAGGISQAALGREYGVHQHPIWAIVNGKSWKHVL